MARESCVLLSSCETCTDAADGSNTDAAQDHVVIDDRGGGPPQVPDDRADRRVRLVTGLHSAEDANPRIAPLVPGFEQFADELQKSERGAKEKRSWWHDVQRFGASAGSAAAAAGGGALTAQFQGRGAVVLGVAILVLGLTGAAVTGLGAEAESERNRRKKRQYEQLWWELYVYVAVELPGATAAEADATLVKFIRRRAAVGDPGYTAA